jgi:hypothetical protein
MNRHIDRLDPTFDPRIADWLEDDPDRAPGEVIDTILAALPSIPQRRTTLSLPRRFPPMPSSAKLALTAVAIAAVGLVGLTFLRAPVIGPAASPSATASPSPVTGPPSSFTERFDSPLHGLSIGYPSGWQTRAATEPWTGGELNFDSAAADVIFDPTLGDRLYMVLASQPYGGLSQDAWRDAQGAWLCTGNGAAMGWPTVDGVDAFAITCGSTASAALIFTDTRGYLIRLVVSSDEPRLAETYDWDWHRAALETVDLRPEEALDAPSPSESP